MTEQAAVLSKILIVDDELIMIRLLDDMLQTHYSLQFATTGADALALVFSNPPDLILLDVELPDLSGYEICRAIRDNPATRDLPVIFLTSNDQQSEVQRGLEVGGTAYVIKPFRVGELLTSIENQLGKHQQ